MSNSIKISRSKYQEKVNKLLGNLKQDSNIKTVNDLRKVQPLDNRAFYWLKDQGILKLNGYGNIVPTKAKITSDEAISLVKHIRKLRDSYKRSKPAKKRAYTRKAPVSTVDKPVVSNLAELILDKAKGKNYDLTLNVKLVVTSIEYKL